MFFPIGCCQNQTQSITPDILNISDPSRPPYEGDRNQRAGQRWDNWGRYHEQEVWIEDNGFARIRQEFPDVQEACHAYLNAHWERWGENDGFRLEHWTKHSDLWVLSWRVDRELGRGLVTFYDSNLDRVIAVTMEAAR